MFPSDKTLKLIDSTPVYLRDNLNSDMILAPNHNTAG
jgi:hypothetical protein